MNKIKLIIRREYLTRVRKKSFVIMTIVGPVLMAAIMVIPIWLSMMEQDTQFIEVIDESGLFVNNIPETETIKFKYPSTGSNGADLEKEKAGFYDEDYTAILFIPRTVMISTQGIQLFYKKQPGITTLRYLEEAIENEIESGKLTASGIDKKILESVKTNVRINTINLEESGAEEKSYTEINMVAGILAGFLIYIFIFLYGTQVMRGVIEEKTGRIVEVIISSVKPFQLMMGKIIGVAMVGLTQFLLWIVLTFFIVSAVKTIFLPGKFDTAQIQALSQMPSQTTRDIEKTINPGQMNEILEAIGSIDPWIMIGSFLFFFMGGYLLYGALFAAIGAAVDNETDTQQFILPITIPLILAFIMGQFIIENPEGQVSFWFSIIPLTSPIIMMVRIPFGVPYWEIALSIILLILGFLAATWVAAKIYRTGILMYGKKVNYRELWKWLFY
ncbi:MAG: ABC transporter permease [Bacteroidota bacterium]